MANFSCIYIYKNTIQCNEQKNTATNSMVYELTSLTLTLFGSKSTFVNHYALNKSSKTKQRPKHSVGNY